MRLCLAMQVLPTNPAKINNPRDAGQKRQLTHGTLQLDYGTRRLPTTRLNLPFGIARTVCYRHSGSWTYITGDFFI